MERKPEHKNLSNTISNILKFEAERFKLVAKGSILGVGSGLGSGALMEVVTTTLNIGDPNSRVAAALIVGLTSLTYVHLRVMRNDYRRLLQMNRQKY